LNSKAVEKVEREKGLWYESPEEVAAGLRAGRRRAVRMRWVLRQMERRLSARERRCVELYYLRGLSYRDVAAEVGSTRAKVERMIRRAIAELRKAASLSGIEERSEGAGEEGGE
jgi:RNA polymerase sigma factor (sigma-70 family)